VGCEGETIYFARAELAARDVAVHVFICSRPQRFCPGHHLVGGKTQHLARPRSSLLL